MVGAMGRVGLAVGTVVVALVAGCKGPAVPSPLVGQYRYTCCNVRYEKPEITDVNYTAVGAMIPFGTRVQILEVRKNQVRFQPDGHPEITLAYRHGRKILPLEQFLEREFLVENPRVGLKKVPAKTMKQIEQGVIEEGMTRQQVLLAVGYPPVHRTASIESPIWTYWRNRWETFQVFFDGDKVGRVGR